MGFGLVDGPLVLGNTQQAPHRVVGSRPARGERRPVGHGGLVHVAMVGVTWPEPPCGLATSVGERPPSVVADEESRHAAVSIRIVSTRQYQTGASLPGQGWSEPGAVSTNAETKSLWALRKADGSIEAGWYLVPLRLFLGVTFVFAALQKLANPNFFRNTSPISIHAQLLAATHTSPIHALVSPLASLSTAVGVVIALGELAVGVGTLLGLITRGAAVGGLLLNLMLFLTVSFHAAPFYTGSDIVFVFAWTPLILAGAAGAPALDTWLVRQRQLAAARSPEGNAVTTPGVSRRSVVSVGAVTAAVAGVAAVLGGAAVGLGRAIGGTSASTGGTRLLSSGATIHHHVVHHHVVHHHVIGQIGHPQGDVRRQCGRRARRRVGRLHRPAQR